MNYRPREKQLQAEVLAEMDLRGVSLSDLAAGSGIGLGTLNRCLAGETAFTIDVLSRVARTLGTTASDLLARSKTEHP